VTEESGCSSDAAIPLIVSCPDNNCTRKTRKSSHYAWSFSEASNRGMEEDTYGYEYAPYSNWVWSPASRPTVHCLCVKHNLIPLLTVWAKKNFFACHVLRLHTYKQIYFTKEKLGSVNHLIVLSMSIMFNIYFLKPVSV